VRKKLLLTFAGLTFLAALAVGAAGWYFAGVIGADGLRVEYEPDPYTVEVVEVRSGTIVLRDIPPGDAADNLRHAANWGIEAETGYGRLAAIIAEDGATVERTFELLTGAIAAGDQANLSRAAFPQDPLTAHGIAYEEVDLEGELGALPAWFVPGDSDTWAIFVHGRRGTRTEALRLLPVFADLGFPSLVITYRNDDGIARDPSGMDRYGQTEWLDLETAVEYALANGAEDVVLVGYSMGGALVANFLYQSEFSDRVTAAVLDAPMLDFGRTVDLGAEERSVPGIITWTAKRLTTLRYDVDWSAVNYLGRVDDLDVPVLLFHGDEDTRVPKSTSDDFAAARPDIVQYEEFPGAQHVGAWNVDRPRYEAAVTTFLAETLR
jgi:hypothetical protein